MELHEKIADMRQKAEKLKEKQKVQVKTQVFKFQPFSRKQKQVLTWWTPGSFVKDYDGIIADGAIRSGKTVCMSLSFVMWAMESFNGQNFAMCGKTIGSFRRNVLFWLKLMLKSRGYQVSDHRADNLVVIRRGEVVNNFYIFGGKDERSQDLIQGITLAGLFCDEVALMPESFVNQATGRLSVTGSKMWFNCNPAGPMHWFKVNWIDKAIGYLGKEKVSGLKQEAEGKGAKLEFKKLLYLHFTMDDNLSLSEEIKARYRSMYVGVFFQRYIEGLWSVAEGLIYTMCTDESFYGDKERPKGLRSTAAKYIAVDYGTTNPCVFLEILDDGNTIWVDREYRWESRSEQARHTGSPQKTDTQYADDMGEFMGKQPEEQCTIIVDPSAASFIAELRSRGFYVKPANNEVLDGIRVVSTLLSGRKIRIHQSCTGLRSEMQSYSWDEKAAERGEEKPVKQQDHGPDALRYYCMTILPKWRITA